MVQKYIIFYRDGGVQFCGVWDDNILDGENSGIFYSKMC